MSIYIFSILSGYEMGGVDAAQARRGKMLEKSGEKVTYVFTDVPDEYYIRRYRNLGISDDKMLSAHAFLTGKTELSGRFSASDYIAKYQRIVPNIKVIREEKRVQLFEGNKRTAVMELRDDEESIYAINRYESERLIAQDIYTDRLMWTHHYITADDGNGAYAKRDRTTFYDADGRVCFDMFKYEGEEFDPYAYVHGYNAKSVERYVFPNGQVLDQFAFLERFVKKMNMTESDVVILDRPLGEKWIEPLFRLRKLPQILVYHHSDHYFLPGEEIGALGWNKEYLYYIRNIDKIAGFVVASEDQKADMLKRFRDEGLESPIIYVAPTCGLEKLEYPVEERRPYSLITASRLHSRKKPDMLIRAVIKAHEKIPQLSIDIYGDGVKAYVDELKEIVISAGAESYIRFMGHQDMDGRYLRYEAFVSASTWECMSVSMMEAVAAGNAVIGWDVRYSSRMYIKNRENGVRIPVVLAELADSQYENIYVEKMADAIADTFKKRDTIKKYAAGSYEIAERFLDDRLSDIWVKIIREVAGGMSD